MKKLIMFLLVLFSCFSMSACGTDLYLPEIPGVPDLNIPEIPDEPEKISEWPDNEHTKNIPAPTEGQVISSELTDACYTVYMFWSTEAAEAYVEALKSVGYNQDVDKIDLPGTLDYTISNSEGRKINVSVVGEKGSINIYQ